MSVEVHIGAQVSFDASSLPEKASLGIVRRTTHKDPLYAKRRRMMLPTEDLEPYMVTHDPVQLACGAFKVWRGALGDVLRILKRCKVRYILRDARLWLPEVDFGSTVELRDYQVHPFEVMKQRQQTVGRGAAGSGKTEMMMQTAAWFKQPTLVLVWNQRQQNVWLERVARYFSVEPGGIGGSFKQEKITPFTIGMVQSVRNRMDRIAGLFGCVICDEVQRFAASTFREVVNALPAAVRLGASDDERRKDGREFLIYDTFGPRGWKLKRDTGQCPVDIFAVPTKFSYRVAGFRPDWSDLIDTMVKDDARNTSLIRLVRQLVREGLRVLVWSDRVEHCRSVKRALVSKGVKAGLLIGGPENEKEANATERGLRNGSVEVGVGTSVAEQSINIPSLGAGVMTCASADPDLYRFRQMRGRLARPDPDNPDKRGQLYYLLDRRVPILAGRINNIRRGYTVKKAPRWKRTYKKKELAMPARRTKRGVVTVETLTAGAQALGLKVPPKATEAKLKSMVERELSKSEEYGGFCCEDCGADLMFHGLSACPFCGAEFVFTASSPEGDEGDEPAGEEYTDEGEGGEEEQVPEEEYTEGEEYTDEGEVTADEGEGADDAYYTDPDCSTEAEWDSEGGVANVEYVDDGENAVVYDSNGNGWSVTEEGLVPYGEHEGDVEVEHEEGEEVEPDEEPEPEPAPARRRRRAAPSKQDKEASRAAKRQKVEEELPYTKDQLVEMKRPVLVMVAGVLGIKDPAKRGDNAKLAGIILQVQAKKYKTDPKTGRKATRAPSKKAAPAKRPPAKRKAPAKKAPARRAPARRRA